MLLHLRQANIPREQVHAIRENLPVAEAATEYAGQLLRLDKTVLPRKAEGERLLISLHLPILRWLVSIREGAIWLARFVGSCLTDLQHHLVAIASNAE